LVGIEKLSKNRRQKLAKSSALGNLNYELRRLDCVDIWYTAVYSETANINPFPVKSKIADGPKIRQTDSE